MPVRAGGTREPRRKEARSHHASVVEGAVPVLSNQRAYNFFFLRDLGVLSVGPGKGRFLLERIFLVGGEGMRSVECCLDCPSIFLKYRALASGSSGRCLHTAVGVMHGGPRVQQVSAARMSPGGGAAGGV